MGCVFAVRDVAAEANTRPPSWRSGFTLLVEVSSPQLDQTIVKDTRRVNSASYVPKAFGECKQPMEDDP
jgi:hypothetical protein